MNALSSLAQMFSAAAWPVAAVIIAILFRGPVKAALGGLKKLKWQGLEAEFGKELGRARDLIDHEPLETMAVSTDDALGKRDQDFILRLAELSPRSVMLEAWREVEAAVRRMASPLSAGGEPRNAPSAAAAAKGLREAGKLDDSRYEIFELLRGLRNQAVHDTDFRVRKSDAVEYAIMARRLARSIDAIGSKQ
jgi:hypothetical protein